METIRIIGVPSTISAGDFERLQSGRMTPDEARNYARARNAEAAAHRSRLEGRPASPVAAIPRPAAAPIPAKKNTTLSTAEYWAERRNATVYKK